MCVCVSLCACTLLTISYKPCCCVDLLVRMILEVLVYADVHFYMYMYLHVYNYICIMYSGCTDFVCTVRVG